MTPQQLKIKRQFLGLTQEELAKMFLITARTIRNYETGATVIPKTFEMALNALELERK
jgi:transcriptional regulator with XRE-family HTH domain